MHISSVQRSWFRSFLQYNRLNLSYAGPANLTQRFKMHASCKKIESSTRQPPTPDGIDNEGNTGSFQSPPPQVDGGKDAWCFLAAVFLFEAVIWGL